MRGAINATFINRTIVNGAGWESFRSIDLFISQADAQSTSSGTTALGVASSLEDGADWMLGLTLTSVDAQVPYSLANHTTLSSAGASVGAQSAMQMDGQGTALNSAVAVAASLIGAQAAHALLAAGKLNDLAAALTAVQAGHTLAATATVQLAGTSIFDQLDHATLSSGLVSVASMAQLLDGDDTLAALVRMLLAHRHGTGISRHGQGGRVTPHTYGSKLTVH